MIVSALWYLRKFSNINFVYKFQFQLVRLKYLIRKTLYVYIYVSIPTGAIKIPIESIKSSKSLDLFQFQLVRLKFFHCFQCVKNHCMFQFQLVRLKSEYNEPSDPLYLRQRYKKYFKKKSMYKTEKSTHLRQSFINQNLKPSKKYFHQIK